MNVIAINGSPRKNWNTDTLLKKVLEGAESAGAETEMVYLYDLKFCGCKSCMACKLKKEPRPNRCVLRDELTPVLDKVHEAQKKSLLLRLDYLETVSAFNRALGNLR